MEESYEPAHLEPTSPAPGNPGLEGLLDGAADLAQQGLDQLLELGPGQLLLDVQRGLGDGIQADEGQRDGGLGDRRQLDLGLLLHPRPSAAR